MYVKLDNQLHCKPHLIFFLTLWNSLKKPVLNLLHLRFCSVQSSNSLLPRKTLYMDVTITCISFTGWIDHVNLLQLNFNFSKFHILPAEYTNLFHKILTISMNYFRIQLLLISFHSKIQSIYCEVGIGLLCHSDELLSSKNLVPYNHSINGL
jgi:hypothetical protein